MIRPFYTAAAIRFAIAISVERAAAVVALPMRSTDTFPLKKWTWGAD